MSAGFPIAHGPDVGNEPVCNANIANSADRPKECQQAKESSGLLAPTEAGAMVVAAGARSQAIGQREATYLVSRAPIRISQVTLHDANDLERYVYYSGAEVRIRVHWKGQSLAENVCVGVRIDGERHQAVAGYQSREHKSMLCGGCALDGEGTFVVRINSLCLGAGVYYISISLQTDDIIQSDESTIFRADRIASFCVRRKYDYPYTYLCEIDAVLIES